MSWVATAVIGGSIVGAGASIISGNKAADAMKSSASQNAALQQSIYNQQRADQAPYRDVGYSALNAYARAMGLPGANIPGPGQQTGPNGLIPTPEQYNGKRQIFIDNEGNGFIQAQYGENKGELVPIGQRYPQYIPKDTAPPAPSGDDRYGGFYESPGYQYRYDEGQKAIDRNAAARGLFQSGPRAKAAIRFGQNEATNEFSNYTNRLAALAGVGQTAVNQTNRDAALYGAQTGNANMNAGMARASGYLNTGGAISSGVNNVLAALPYFSGGGGGQGFDPSGYNSPGYEDIYGR